jgi:hypothetical protein
MNFLNTVYESDVRYSSHFSLKSIDLSKMQMPFFSFANTGKLFVKYRKILDLKVGEFFVIKLIRTYKFHEKTL